MKFLELTAASIRQLILNKIKSIYSEMSGVTTTRDERRFKLLGSSRYSQSLLSNLDCYVRYDLTDDLLVGYGRK